MGDSRTQAVRENVQYPVNQFNVVPLIFGNLAEAITYPFILDALVLRDLDVEIMSILLNQLHRFELTHKLLLGHIIHHDGPVPIADV